MGHFLVAPLLWKDRTVGMPRHIRVEYPGAIYHVLDRGGRRETTLTLKQIAARLHLGTSKSASVRPGAWMREKVSKPRGPGSAPTKR